MYSFLQSSRLTLSRLFSTRSGKLIGIIVLIAASSLLVVQVKQVQTLQQRAEEPLINAVQNGPFTLNVLAIGFNPVEGDKNVADTYYGVTGTNRMGGRTAVENEEYIFNSTKDAFTRLSGGTINYNIVHRMNITSFPRYTNGYQFTIDNYKQCVWGTPEFNPTLCDQQKVAFDHNAWLSDNRICELMEEKGADEVWVVSNPYIMRWESFLFGPKDGFFVNAPPVTTATCKKNYILMDATYDAADNFMESYAHRVESIMDYLTNAWGSVDRKKYWVDFASWDHRRDGDYSVPTCGNAHWPANALKGYDFNNSRMMAFTCPDWKNFPNLTGVTETINCTAWGCSDKGWQEHWFGALPKSDGEVSLTSATGIPFTFKKNWWYYLLYPENAIAQKKAEISGVPGVFTSSSSVLKGDVATFNFTYSGTIPEYHVDMTQRSDFSTGIYLSFAKGANSPLIVNNPQAKWDQYRCGRTMYWRVSNIDRTVKSEIQSVVITCVVPSSTPTITPTPTLTPTLTPTSTPTNTPTPTRTPTPTPKPSNKNFYPTDDATIRSDKPTNNYGTSTTVSVDGNPKFIALLKFNLSSLAGKRLKSAQLRLWVNNSSSGSFGIFPTSSVSWTEAAVAYVNRPSLGGRIGVFTAPTNGSWVSVDLTSFVKTKLGAKMGIAITTTSSDAMSFNSQENAVNKPRLTVSYQ